MSQDKDRAEAVVRDSSDFGGDGQSDMLLPELL
jgi:hypothetical protein